MAEIFGGCLCGSVRYRITGSPAASVLCHCTTCRKAHAAQSVAWIGIDRTQLRIIAGEPHRFHSSTGVTRQFCESCGTPIAYENTASAATIDIATLTLDDPAAFPPTAEIWLEHRVPWVAVAPSLRHFPRSSLDADAGEVFMTRRLISSGSKFEHDIGYSRAVVDGEWIFVSGTTGFDYAAMTISDDLLEQTEQAMKNIQSALQQAGADLADVVRVTYLLPRGERFADCWPVLRKYFGAVRPAATMFSAGLADPRMQIEIEVTARLHR